MLLSIIFGISTMLLVATIKHALRGGKVFEATEERVFLLGNRRVVLWSKVDEKDWVNAFIVGAVVFLIHAFVLELRGWALFLGAPLALITMIGLMIYLMARWCDDDDGGSTIIDLLLFIGLAVVFYYVADVAAYAVSAIWDNKGLMSLIMILPVFFLVLCIGFFVTNLCIFRSRENGKVYENDTDEDIKKKKDLASTYGILAGIFGIITAVILSLLLINGVDWANFNEPARNAGADGSAKGNSAGSRFVGRPLANNKGGHLSDEEKIIADNRVKVIVITPSNVDQRDVDKFYAIYGRELMENTWPGNARARKDNSARLLDGNGLYGAVEFPVDVALCFSADYKIDHEGSYTDDELEKIRDWIEEKLKSGELSDVEKNAIIDWAVVRIARDPVYGHMWAQTFSELHSFSGKTVREMYPDYDQFLTDWEDGKRLEYYSCTHNDGEVRYVNPEYEPYGFAIATTFMRWSAVCVSKPTAYHFRMEDVTVMPSKMTTIKAPGMESLAAVVFTTYEKDFAVFKEQIALNPNDGRSEIIPEPEPEPEPTTPTPTTVQQTTPASTTPAPTTPTPTTVQQTTPAPTTPVPTTPTPTDPTTQPYTKDISKGVTDPAKVTQPVDTTGPGTRNTESSLTPPSTAYPQPTEPPTTSAPTTEYVEPTLPTHEEETTAVPPTTVDSRESSEIWSQDPTEPPVYYSDPASPTTGQQTDPEPSWGGPSD